jgi:hypothetical protein
MVAFREEQVFTLIITSGITYKECLYYYCHLLLHTYVICTACKSASCTEAKLQKRCRKTFTCINKIMSMSFLKGRIFFAKNSTNVLSDLCMS